MEGNRRSDFRAALEEALAEARARTTAPLTPSEYDKRLGVLRQHNKDKLDALTQIQQWLMKGANHQPVLDAPCFARGYHRFWQYTLTYMQGGWWISRAIPRIVTSRDYSLQEVTALEYLDHISLQAIAGGVARLVSEEVYNPPNFD
jgi:hypothetical protein